jgi:Tfp pilus assembly protein PilN
MRAIRLDYQRNMKPLPWLGLWVLALALVGLALLGSYYHELNKHIAFWQGRADHVEHLYRHSAYALRPTSAQTEREHILEVEHANQVLRQLSLPWNTMFKAVESSSGKTVALLSMEPDMQKGTIRISGEAKSFVAMLDYVRQLEQREVFGSVYLQNHQVQQDDPQKPVRFTLLAVWKGAAS